MKISNCQIGLLVILVTFHLSESASLAKFRTPQVNYSLIKVHSTIGFVIKIQIFFLLFQEILDGVKSMIKRGQTIPPIEVKPTSEVVQTIRLYKQEIRRPSLLRTLLQNMKMTFQKFEDS